MTERTADISPRLEARIAGGLYLIIIVGGFFSEALVRERLLVNGDAAATARNIMAHELLYRLGFAAGMILLPCNVPLALIFYDLFKVVNRSLSALVAFFILVGAAIESVDLLYHYAPLIILQGARYSSGFTTEQLQALAYMSLRLHAVGFNISLVSFAFYDLLAGYLLLESSFFPRILGVLMAIAGLCYVTDSFANFLSPGFAAHLVPYILVPSGLGELSLCLWLLVIGLNEPRWQKRAHAAEERQMKAAV